MAIVSRNVSRGITLIERVFVWFYRLVRDVMAGISLWLTFVVIGLVVAGKWFGSIYNFFIFLGHWAVIGVLSGGLIIYVIRSFLLLKAYWETSGPGWLTAYARWRFKRRSYLRFWLCLGNALEIPRRAMVVAIVGALIVWTGDGQLQKLIDGSDLEHKLFRLEMAVEGHKKRSGELESQLYGVTQVRFRLEHEELRGAIAAARDNLEL